MVKHAFLCLLHKKPCKPLGLHVIIIAFVWLYLNEEEEGYVGERKVLLLGIVFVQPCGLAPTTDY
jgi:hypothetical protein